MELIDALHKICQQSQQASAPTDLVTGTVVKTSPLEISINPQMRPIKRQLLYLTSAVIEKKLPILEHTHVLPAGETVAASGHLHALTEGETDPALKESEIACLENGEELPVEDGYLILNRGLREKDRVLMLRVQHGQRFIVLSRIFEK